MGVNTIAKGSDLVVSDPGSELVEELQALADTVSAQLGHDHAAVAEILHLVDLASLARQSALDAKTEPKLCAKRDPTWHGTDHCDRPASHKGSCSWEAQRLRRRVRDHDTLVEQLTQARHDLNESDRRADRAERELRAVHAKPRGLRRLLRRR